MKRVKFIHSADLHLDSPMTGLSHLPKSIFERLKESTFRAFKTLIDQAILHRVDFVILAGDIFDLDDRSIRAQIRLQREMERLHREGIPCFVVFGNHDHLGGNWTYVEMPQNVVVFGEEVEAKELYTNDGAKVILYGFSYADRHVFTRKINDYKKTDKADYHIGILHGNLEGGLEHGNYAPFTLNELLKKDYDYWALGHIHKRTILSESPPVVYPGNTQGRNRKEKDRKGCYVVTLSQSGSNLQFIETSDIIWSDLTVDVDSIESIDELYQACVTALDHERREGKGILAHISIINATADITDNSSYIIDELLELLQDEEKEEESFVWPYSIKIENSIQWNRDDLAGKSDFYSELFDIVNENIGIEESLATLYDHRSARRFLTVLDKKEIEELKTEAENFLIQELLRQK